MVLGPVSLGLLVNASSPVNVLLTRKCANERADMKPMNRTFFSTSLKVLHAAPALLPMSVMEKLGTTLKCGQRNYRLTLRDNYIGFEAQDTSPGNTVYIHWAQFSACQGLP